MIQKSRMQIINQNPLCKGRYVLYWMQQSQREDYNHALEYAIEQANSLGQPLVVLFCIFLYPEANLRHYHFMMQGILETVTALYGRGIQTVSRTGVPSKIVPELATDASLVITDIGYLRHLRKMRTDIASKISCRMIQVESDVVVPVKEASTKEEFSAGTLRPKILSKLKQYLIPLKKNELKYNSLGLKFDSISLADTDKTIKNLPIDSSASPVKWIHGGGSYAEEYLHRFITEKLDHYNEYRNDPSMDYTSNLSPFIHFGQISALRIALEVSRSKKRGADDFLEELIIRRELACNFTFYNQQYDSIMALPRWAQSTLNEHAADHRSVLYSLHELESAKTEDPYWNAAQTELIIKGKMHGYMRMYWGKKIIEWTENPSNALSIALYLNNKYELDGRDPNGYAGVLWCFGKHDRAWKERPVFGKVRYMNDNGLRRKFAIDRYLKNINLLKIKDHLNEI